MSESMLNICVLVSVVIVGAIAIYHKLKSDNLKSELVEVVKILTASNDALDWYHARYTKLKSENERLRLYIKLYNSGLEVTPDIEIILKEIEENG